MKVVGVDAGKDGGICFLRDGEVVDLWKTPLLDDRTLDADCVFHRLIDFEPDLMVIESCWRPRGLVVQCGEYIGIGKVVGCRVHEVGPSRWKKILLGQNTSDKAVSVAKCRELYPAVNLVRPRCRTPDDGLAEAVLLARYLYDQEKGWQR